MRKILYLLLTATNLVGVGASAGQEIEAVSLYDSFGNEDHGAVLNWGFSALIRYQGKTILFDGGASAQILKGNSAALGVDLRDVDIAVLSHSHYDHISGFDHLLEVNPDVKIFLPKDRTIGGRPTRNEEQAEWNAKHKIGYRFPGADVRYVDEPYEVAPGNR